MTTSLIATASLEPWSHHQHHSRRLLAEKRQTRPDNSFYGLAIGFTVVAGAFAVGAISGGAVNLAATLGTAAMGVFAWPTLCVYMVAQILAGITFLVMNPDDE